MTATPPAQPGSQPSGSGTGQPGVPPTSPAYGPTGQPGPATPTGTPQTGTTGTSEGSLDSLAKAVVDAAKQARAQVAHAVAANRGRIEGAVDKLATVAHEKTQGKYAKEVATAKQWIGKGVDVVAGTPGVSSSTLSSPLPPVAPAPTPQPSPGPVPSPTASSTPGPTTTPGAPSTPPAAPTPPQSGWRRGADGQWIRS